MGFTEQKTLGGIIPLSPPSPVEGPICVGEDSDGRKLYLIEKDLQIWQVAVDSNGLVEQSDNSIPVEKFNAEGGWKLPNGRRIRWETSFATQEL